MDIRQWLQNTADREPPDERVETRFPAFLQPRSVAVQSRRKTRQKRKRTSSYTSGHADRPSVQPFSSDQARLRRCVEATSSQSSFSSSSASRQNTVTNRRAAPIETFQRRARHKTKPDLYEAKPKRRKKEHRSIRERKPESRRRKSHRSGDGARTTGLVQSFQLKNGPKKQRLTLKPDASAGVFKNGRASGPIATSGPGLPDLVFNEMRFLRKPKEHQDEVVVNDSKKQSKKTQRQSQEEEVSAYFDKNLPRDRQTGLAKRDIVQSQAVKQIAQQRPPEPLLGPLQHHAEFPEKAFLGFGSRGPLQDGIESQHPSNSHYTWSESLPGKLSPLPSRPNMAVLEARSDQHGSRCKQASQALDTPPLRGRKGPVRSQQSRSLAEGGQSVKSRGRAIGAALGEMHQPPTVTTRHTSTAKQSPGSTPRINHASDAAYFEEMDGCCERRGDHTSDILQIRHLIAGAAGSPSQPVQERMSETRLDNEDGYPTTSTPTSERLRYAFEKVTDPEIRTEREVQRASRPNHEERVHTLARPSSTQRDRTHEHAEVVSNPPPWKMPQRGFSRTTDSSCLQPTAASRLATATRAPNTRQPRSREAHWARDEPNDEREEEMFDVLPGAAWIRPQRHSAFINSREAEALVRHLVSDDQDRLVYQTDADITESAFGRHDYAEQEKQIGAEEVLEPTRFEPELFSLHSQQVGGQPLGGQFQSEYCTVDNFQGEQQVDSSHQEVRAPGLVGFWRPNILY